MQTTTQHQLSRQLPTQHPLTLQARSLLAQQAVLDVALLDTLNAIVAKKVYAADGYSSSHTYCVMALGMSDDSAARRMKAADLMRRYPALLRPMIERREVHLTGLARLHSVINDRNAETLLNEARGKTKREIEALVLRINPKAAIASAVVRVPAKQIVMTELPAPRFEASGSGPGSKEALVLTNLDPGQRSGWAAGVAAGDFAAPVRGFEARVMSKAPAVEMRAPNLYAFRTVMDEETKALYEQVKDLAADKDPVVILRRALGALLVELRSRKQRKLKRIKAEATVESKPNGVDVNELSDRTNGADLTEVIDDSNGRVGGPGATFSSGESTCPSDTLSSDVVLGRGCWAGPRGRTRYIDAATVRAVYERDNGRCTFVGNGGHVCGATRNLQTHHRDAFANGGSNAAWNLTLHCATHNLYQAELDFGPREAALAERRGGGSSHPGWLPTSIFSQNSRRQ